MSDSSQTSSSSPSAAAFNSTLATNLSLTMSDKDVAEFEHMQQQAETELLKSLHNPQDLRINAFIKSKMPTACLIQNVGSELTYSISNKPEFTRHYNKFFSQLEASTDKLGIESIGLSDSTLEEIFIKLAKQPQDNTLVGSDKKLFGLVNLTVMWERIISCTCFCPNRGKQYQAGKLTDEQISQYSEFTKRRIRNPFHLVFQQLYALLVKRFHRVKRNIKGFFAEIVLPVVFVCLALLVATLNPTEGSEPALEIHPWYYGTPNQFFVAKTGAYGYDEPTYGQTPFELNMNPRVQTNIDQVDQVYETFLQAPGPGTRCMSNHQIIVKHSDHDYSRNGPDHTLPCNSYDFSLNNNYTVMPLDVAMSLDSVNYSYTKTAPKCDCSGGFPVCAAASLGDIYYRPVHTLKTQDIMYDLSGRNITDWVINTEFSDKMFKKRFGGFEFLQPFINSSDSLLPDLVTQVQTFGVTVQSLLQTALPGGNFTGLREATAALVNEVIF
jgi:ATP-binding cassette subfamily A (ABC1) protein 1